MVVNLVFFQLVKFYGKGFVVYVDCVNIWGGIYDDLEIGIIIVYLSVLVVIESVFQNKLFFVDVDIISGKFDMYVLQV